MNLFLILSSAKMKNEFVRFCFFPTERNETPHLIYYESCFFSPRIFEVLFFIVVDGDIIYYTCLPAQVYYKWKLKYLRDDNIAICAYKQFDFFEHLCLTFYRVLSILCNCYFLVLFFSFSENKTLFIF